MKPKISYKVTFRFDTKVYGHREIDSHKFIQVEFIPGITSVYSHYPEFEYNPEAYTTITLGLHWLVFEAYVSIDKTVSYL